jgi:hypothetical protein
MVLLASEGSERTGKWGQMLGGDRFLFLLFLLKIFCFHANYSDFATFLAKQSGNGGGASPPFAQSHRRLRPVLMIKQLHFKLDIVHQFTFLDNKNTHFVCISSLTSVVAEVIASQI